MTFEDKADWEAWADWASSDEQQSWKYDFNKARMDLVSPVALKAVAMCAGLGSEKYGDRNWEHGLQYSRVLGALLRHINAWHAGERIDPESGQSHMAHAAWNAMALVHYEQTGAGTDDIPAYKGGTA